MLERQRLSPHGAYIPVAIHPPIYRSAHSIQWSITCQALHLAGSGSNVDVLNHTFHQGYELFSNVLNFCSCPVFFGVEISSSWLWRLWVYSFFLPTISWSKSSFMIRGRDVWTISKTMVHSAVPAPPLLLFSTEKGQVSGTGAQGGQCPGLEGELGPPLRAQEKWRLPETARVSL